MKTPVRTVTFGFLTCACLGSAYAGDLARQSGHWEISVTVTGQSTYTSQVCIDMATDGIALTAGSSAPQSDCERAAATQTGEEISLESVCKQGNSTVTTIGTLSGNLDSAYTGKIVKQYSPPLYGRTEIESSVEGRFLGPCP